MWKSKSASWIAFSIGFSIASPQAAFAADPNGGAIQQYLQPKPTTLKWAAAAPVAPAPKDFYNHQAPFTVVPVAPVAPIPAVATKKSKPAAKTPKKIFTAAIRLSAAQEKKAKELKKNAEAENARASREITELEKKLQTLKAEYQALQSKKDEERRAAVAVVSEPGVAEVKNPAQEKADKRTAEIERETAEIDDRIKKLNVIIAASQTVIKEQDDIISKNRLAIAEQAPLLVPVVTAAPPADAPTAVAPVPALQQVSTFRETTAKVERNRRAVEGADLTKAELEQAFIGLSFVADEKSGLVKMDFNIPSGTGENNCLAILESNVAITKASDPKDDHQVGIQISDPKKLFLNCVTAVKARSGFKCNDGKPENKCVSYSRFTADEKNTDYREMIDLPKNISRPVTIGVFVKDSNATGAEELKFEQFDSFKSSNTLAQEKKAVARTKAELDRKIYSCAVAQCITDNDLKEARKACESLKKLSFLGLLDGKTKKEIAEEYAQCSGEIDEKTLAELADEFQKATDYTAIKRLADRLVAFAQSNRRAANAVAEILFGKADAMANSADSQVLPALAALNIPGVFTLGANNNPQLEAARNLKGTEEKLAVARELFKKGLKLGTTKDWPVLFNQKLTQLDFIACDARAKALGITAPQVQACLKQNATTAQVMVQNNCQTDQYSTSCIDSQMLYQGLQATYGTAVQKSQELAMAKQNQMMQAMNAQQQGVMGNGSGFLGLNSLGGAQSALPGGLTPINPGNGLPALQNLGNRNPGMNFQGNTTPNLSGVSFR